MGKELFRREVEDANNRLQGRVILASPASLSVLTALISAVCFVGLATVAFGNYARKETVTGWLVPDRGMARIIARTGGIVDSIHVVEGEEVEKGQVLVTISSDVGLESGLGAAESILESIERQRGEWRDRLINLDLRYETRRERLSNHKQGVAQEIEHAAGRVELQRQKIELAQEQIATMEELAKQGFIAELELQGRRESLLSEKQTLAEYKENVTELMNENREIESQIKLLPLEKAAEVSEVQLQLTELEGRKAEIATRRGYVLRAPFGGRVTGILLRPGEVVTPSQSIMALLPHGGKLQAQLFAPTRAVGFVESGQEVQLFYEAFPYEIYGSGKGTVISISKTILNPGEIPVQLPLDEPVYRILVELEQNVILAGEHAIPLQAGMLLKADIVFQRRPLWEWMLDPLIRARRG